MKVEKHRGPRFLGPELPPGKDRGSTYSKMVADLFHSGTGGVVFYSDTIRAMGDS